MSIARPTYPSAANRRVTDSMCSLTPKASGTTMIAPRGATSGTTS